MAKESTTIFTWIDDKNKKRQYNLEKIESLFYKNKDSLSYKLAQSSSVLKRIFNWVGFKTELEEEKDISVIKNKFKKENIDFNKAKNFIGDNLLLSAVKAKNVPLMESLISVGVDLDSKGNRNQTALHIATELNNQDMVALLIKSGADVNISGENNNTPLHIATELNNKDMVKLLIEKGAGLNLTNKDGYTALHIAAQTNNEKIVEMLIDAKADVNLKTNSSEYTALHYAVKNSNTEVAKMLIDAQADVNSLDSSYQTPLHIAAQKDQKIVEMLIDAKADVNLKDSDGETALDYAKKQNSEKIANILTGVKLSEKSNKKIEKKQNKSTQKAEPLGGAKKSGAVKSEWKRSVINNKGRSR